MNRYPIYSDMKELLNSLVQNKVITTQRVFDAMLLVDRKDFSYYNSYMDRAQYLDYNIVISAPHMHAFALEYLSPKINQNSRILDIGFGSGYLTVALSKMTNDTGTIVGIEHIQGWYDIGLRNINKQHSNWIANKNIVLDIADGREGYLKYAPYDCIHVGAASEQCPQELINQLANGGRIFIPLGKTNGDQYVYLIDKDMNGNVTYQKTISVSYVPLTSPEEQMVYKWN